MDKQQLEILKVICDLTQEGVNVTRSEIRKRVDIDAKELVTQLLELECASFVDSGVIETAPNVYKRIWVPEPIGQRYVDKMEKS